jgi:uncharacterized protein YoxC
MRETAEIFIIGYFIVISFFIGMTLTHIYEALDNIDNNIKDVQFKMGVME